MNIKLITFDLDHTLWNPDEAIQQGESASYAWLAQQVPAFGEQFSPQAFIDQRTQLREQFPALKHRVSELRRIAFATALEKTDIPLSHARELADQAFQIFWQERQKVTIFPETLKLLEDLAAHYTLGALSNGNACLKTIGLAQHFSFHFAAEDFPAAKPAPDLFIAALQKTGVAPHEALHIGDHPIDDVQGARAVGMHTMWVNLHDKPWPPNTNPADTQVQHLRDIAVQLCPHA